MKRKTITKAMKVRIFRETGGKCHVCGLPIRIGDRWEADHKKPLWLGGEDIEENLAPIHIDCHAGKTAQEAPIRAKTNRVAAKHIGATAPKQKIASRGFPKREKREKLPLPPRRGLFQ